MYLIDTNVVSEFRRQKPHSGVAAWIARVADKGVFLSAFSFGEMQRGIEITRGRDLSKALESKRGSTESRDLTLILPCDERVFREWAWLMHSRAEELSEDATLAAKAAVHRLTAATRNVRDIERLGVACIDPFSASA